MPAQDERIFTSAGVIYALQQYRLWQSSAGAPRPALILSVGGDQGRDDWRVTQDATKRQKLAIAIIELALAQQADGVDIHWTQQLETKDQREALNEFLNVRCCFWTNYSKIYAHLL